LHSPSIGSRKPSHLIVNQIYLQEVAEKAESVVFLSLCYLRVLLFFFLFHIDDVLI